MDKKDWKVIITIFATLVASIVSSAMLNLLSQILFIIIFAIICCLAFSYLNEKSKRTLLFLVLTSTFELIILVISINRVSPTQFFEKIISFFVTPQEVSSENIITLDEDLDPYFQDICKKLESIDEKVEGTNNNIEQLDSALSIITNNLENIHYNENENEAEINEIVRLIEEKHDKNSNSLANLKNDPYSIELLYKSTVSDNCYYYCNILEAFNQYGINTEKLNIIENCLFIWDVERLFMVYNMKSSIVNDLDSDEIIPEKIFYYDDFKVSLNRFSDTFDYGDWHKYYTNKTAKEIDDLLNETIINFYKKFVINFSAD